MTQEDKSLLLQDLCARLPYDLKVRVLDINDPTYQKVGNLYNIKYLEGNYNDIPYLFDVDNQVCLCDITEIQPYLRPMSSMTDEEKEEFHKLKQFSVTVVMPNGVSRIKPTYIVDLEEDGEGLNYLYDWLNSHHFDYRGLIEKGLALKAPEGMYKITNII